MSCSWSLRLLGIGGQELSSPPCWACCDPFIVSTKFTEYKWDCHSLSHFMQDFIQWKAERDHSDAMKKRNARVATVGAGLQEPAESARSRYATLSMNVTIGRDETYCTLVLGLMRSEAI